jgi:hypothetical protein
MFIEDLPIEEIYKINPEKDSKDKSKGTLHPN